MEEIVSRDYIIGTSSSPAPDAVINIVDATNLERNLYLTVQLLELEKPVVLALNFMDEARAAGDRIDAVALSAALGIPVVPIVAKTGENIEKLLETAHKQMHEGYTLEPDDLYDDFTHEIHHAISAVMHDNAYAAGLPAHWASIKLLEGDRIVKESLKLSAQQESEIEAVASEYEKAGGGLGDRETLVADSRYLYIENIVRASVRKGAQPGAQTLTEKIDRLATHKYLAVPLFLALMLLMFSLTFGAVGSFLSDMTAGAMEALSDLARGWLGAIGVAQWLQRLVCDGIAVGVGSVLSFLPQIAILFFFLSVLEDSGYMARAAFIMDRLLRRFGLSGKAFIPMLMGFGCSVPAIMGARTMENEKDRRMTILLVPFMSCSAKLPVYGLVASAFFGRWAGIAIFSLYIMGMAGGVLSGIFFKKYIFAGEPAAFVMELPPYRIPSAENTLRHVWERLRGFIARAGTIILLMSVLLWFLESFDSALQMTGDASKSLLAIFGGFLAPLFRPLGFGSWQASVAILTGLIAKEAVVASLSMFYGFDLTAAPADVAASMSGFTPLAAFALLVFVLLYVPCLAAVGALYKEMNSLKWTLFSVAWQIGFAYAASFLAFQLGSLLGFA
jgi:ferrous iron transport protein B